MHQNKIIVFVLFLLLTIGTAKAQVTIGSSIAPRSGALLDLKQDNGTIQNSSKGLGMPRVELADNSTINMGGNIIAPSEYDAHTGLLVYNLKTREGSQITAESEKLCPGLHVWTGSKWVPLKAYDAGLLCVDDGSGGVEGGSIEVVGGKLIYTVASGKDLQIPAPATFDLQWTPTAAAVTVVESVISGFPKITFSPAASNPIGTGTASVSLNADAMADAEIVANPFATKAIKLDYKIVDDKGDTKIVSVEIKQTNHALSVNGKFEQVYVRKIMDGTLPIALNGNVKWDAVSSDTQITPSVLTGGAYTHTGVGNLSNLTASTLRDLTKVPEDLTITFKDNAATIWQDVKYTVSQCKGGAIDRVNDKPAEVDIMTDHEGNKYWVRTFGTAGTWMLENLRTTTYAPVRTGSFKDGAIISGFQEDLSAQPTHGLNSGNGYYDRKWVRPRTVLSALKEEMTEAEFAENQELGLVYDFYAASALRTGDVNGPAIPPRTKIQGICPAGWRIPDQRDFVLLFAEIDANANKYTTMDSPLNSNLITEIDANWNDGYVGTSIFRPGTDPIVTSKFVFALSDVCLLEGNPVSGASLKSKGGFALNYTSYVQDGAYSYTPVYLRTRLWTFSKLLMTSGKLFNTANAGFVYSTLTGIIITTWPSNSQDTPGMMQVRCMKN